MSLRARLTLFFVVIVVLPVTAVTAYGWHAVARSSQRQVRSELELARRSATVAFLARIERANEAVTALANDPALLEALAAGDAPRVRAVLRRQGVTDLLLAVTGPDARVLGRAGRITPGFLPGVRRAPIAMPLPREPHVWSWPMLQRVSVDLRPAPGLQAPRRRWRSSSSSPPSNGGVPSTHPTSSLSSGPEPGSRRASWSNVPTNQEAISKSHDTPTHRS